MGLYFAVLVVAYWNVTGMHIESRAFDGMAACEDFKATLKLQPGISKFVAECSLNDGYRT